MRDKSGWYLTTRQVAIVVFACLVVAGIGEGQARANVQLSFGDWLARQGTRCKDLDGDGLCCEPYVDQYIPANRSYLYWFSWPAPGEGRLAVVDFLGISGSYLASACGVDLGTTTTGSITGHETQDGRVLVSVRGHTINALAYVVDDPNHTGNPSGPLLFGAREADVCSGAQASVVDVEYQIEYYADPMQPIVDNQWFGNPPPSLSCETADDPFDFRFIGFRAGGDGTLADGSAGRLRINQTGTLQSHSHSPSFDGFPVEFIELHPLGK